MFGRLVFYHFGTSKNNYDRWYLVPRLSQEFIAGTENRKEYTLEVSLEIKTSGLNYSWAEIHKYYEECDWSKKWAEGLQKILT